ncbi:MAG: hypothetical protein ACRD0L_06665 [Acidimicrobiales bacterium]
MTWRFGALCVIHIHEAGHGIVRDTAALAAVVERVVEELEELGGGPDVGGSLTDGTLEIEVELEAANPQEAVVTGGSLIRTALHAAGVATPGCPDSEVLSDVLWVAAYELAEAHRVELVEAYPQSG